MSPSTQASLVPLFLLPAAHGKEPYGKRPSPIHLDMEAPPHASPSAAPPVLKLPHDEDEDEDEDEDDYSILPGQVWMEGDSLAPPCQSDLEIVPEIISLANIRATDVFYDLGCGDGRVCIAVAKATGARAKGVEIETNLLERFRTRLARAEALAAAAGAAIGRGAAEIASGSERRAVPPAVGLNTEDDGQEHEQERQLEQKQEQQQQQQQQRQPIPPLRKGQVEIIGRDLLTVGLEDASVIYLYLLPEGIRVLQPRIEAWLEGRIRDEKEEEEEGNEEKEQGTVSRSFNSVSLGGDGRIQKPATRRLVCNMWGLPGRTPTAKRDVGHMANVKLLLYESSS